MANGTPGKKVDAKIKARALELLAKGSSVAQVASRLRLSLTLVRNLSKEVEAEKAKPESEKSDGEVS